MKITIITLILVTIIIIVSCSTTTNDESSPKDQLLITNAIQAHGGKKYEKAAFSFDFRDWSYSFKNNKGEYEYTRKTTKDGKEIFDVLTNDQFTRSIDGKTQDISDEDAAKYSGSLTSVIYFVLLPYKLQDPAVISEYKGTATIKGQDYEIVKVSFKEEGGGEDHDDIYQYWINKETNFVDYLAYSFLVNDGGTRFRSAYNQQTINGIRFQDYENYKSALETPLDSLPILFENESLDKLSVIELENIQVLKK